MSEGGREGKLRRQRDQEFIDAIKADRKIDAIKAYWKRENCSLEEASNHVRSKWNDLRKLYANA